MDVDLKELAATIVTGAKRATQIYAQKTGPGYTTPTSGVIVLIFNSPRAIHSWSLLTYLASMPHLCYAQELPSTPLLQEWPRLERHVLLLVSEVWDILLSCTLINWE